MDEASVKTPSNLRPSFLPAIVSKKDSDVSPLVWSEIFGNQNSVELDLGCGKGLFSFERALADPSRNFMGVDKSGKWMRRKKEGGERLGLVNLRFMQSDIEAFLNRVLSESVEIIHVYFPDPWPKRRHRQRRLLDANFIRLAYEKIKKSGVLLVATDDADYYSSFQKSFEETRPLWKSFRETVGARIRYPEFMTSYEKKFHARGLPLHYAEAIK